MATEETYRSVEVCRLAGCTFRQLDYWCRHGVFGVAQVGLGSGRYRAGFTGADVKVARALARLSAAGLLGGGSQGSGTVGRMVAPIREAAEENAAHVGISLWYSVIVSVSLLADDLSEP